ncbi:MAG TPA: glycosyltransferase family 2 protein [Candidatus Hydrogenedentes bacterium]|nr:glycosyltransferase family 2 protein [Candidatus Hydrogenedentota bacterium]
MAPDTMVLLPARNEADHIAAVIAGVRNVAPEARIAVVDDGSQDLTAERARAAHAVVLPLPCNLGYGVALQTGYKFAVEQGVDYLVQLDSDGQHDPSGIPRLLEVVRSGNFDICIGSRFLEGKTYPIPPLRRAGMIVFRRVASLLLGQTITDPTSGFQAMNRRVLEFFCRDSYPVDYPDTDVLVMLHRHGFRIAEAPVPMHPRATPQSMHRGVRPLYYVFKMTLTIPLNLLRREK